MALVLSACGDDGTAEGSAETSAREGPLYAVSNTLLLPDSVTSYVTVVDSLDAGPAVDLAGSLEFPGSARAYGPDNSDVVYLTASEDATMTEVTFGPDGAARAGRVVSFAHLGVSSTSGGNVLLHISPTKAYFVSQDSLEVVVWNPQEMAVVGTIPLAIPTEPTLPDVYFYPRPIVIGDRLVLVSNRSGELSGSGVVVTVVNTATDQVESTTLEPRCHSMLQSAVDGRGDRYFATSDYAAAEHFLLPDQVPAPCMLRMRAGEVAFDPSWIRTLDGELGTSVWTGVTQGSEGSVYVQGLAVDTPAVSAAADQGAYDVTIAQPWSWYTLGDGDTTPMPADTGLEYPPSFAPIPVDGDAFVAVYDDVDTTLVNLTAASSPRPGLVVPGFVYNVVRIR